MLRQIYDFMCRTRDMAAMFIKCSIITILFSLVTPVSVLVSIAFPVLSLLVLKSIIFYIVSSGQL